MGSKVQRFAQGRGSAAVSEASQTRPRRFGWAGPARTAAADVTGRSRRAGASPGLSGFVSVLLQADVTGRSRIRDLTGI